MSSSRVRVNAAAWPPAPGAGRSSSDQVTSGQGLAAASKQAVMAVSSMPGVNGFRITAS